MFQHHIDDLSDQVLSLMLTAPDARVKTATIDLITALTPSSETPPKGNHLLCVLFEHVAIGLSELIDAPNAVIRTVVGSKVGGSRILASVVRVLLIRAMAAVGPMAPLLPIRLKACALAIAFCPDQNNHRSLDKTCGLPLFEAGAEAADA
ncbi:MULTISPECIES: hypothetical protein [unclassified Curtobacterium]|uniref:hypothetical protein n=1 Tax=unclassified Curtobacterium TaxID=257496 RepID=UPI00104E439D|nr:MULTISPECIES: hypothetical protein [unclassified Curtobacterium]